jgi:hypothetical protein
VAQGESHSHLKPSPSRRRRSAPRALFVVAALLAATEVHADRGALSFDLGGGASALSLPAPYQTSGGNLLAFDFEAMLGVRYAITNNFEFTVSGYFEPAITYAHDGVIAPGLSSSGTVLHSLYSVGALVGVRYVTGFVWRLVVGFEAGWNHRGYADIQAFTSTGQPGGDQFHSFGTDNIVLQPLVGVEWAFADHWSASLLPRFTVLVGPDATVGFSVVLSFSYSWFL